MMSECMMPVKYVIKQSGSPSNACIKNQASIVYEEGLFPAYSASGQDVWLPYYDYDSTGIVLSAVGARCGKSFLATGKYAVCANTHVLLIDSGKCYPPYLHYILNDEGWWEKGGTAQPFVKVKESLNKKIYLPPIEKQKIIAIFLTGKCAEIDRVIADTQKTIEEYKALKQSIITEAVTKGIRPNRPMKDSGVEWIGEIPEDWEKTRFKYFAQVKSNLVPPDEYGDYPQVSPENIEKGSGKLLPCKTVSEVGVISGNHLFYRGQILYSKIRPKLNKIAIAPFDGLCSADMYPIETKHNTRFLLYAMLSDVLLAQVSMITEDRVKMPKINQDELGNTWFAKPPLDEQEEIVAYLDAKCGDLDKLIESKQKLLTELETYKKSVIYEYVTGKKEACG